MEYQIDGIPGFEAHQVVVRSAGLLSGSKLLIDNQVVKGSWGKYTLRRNDGQEVSARLANNLIDPVPQLVVDGQTYSPVPPLPWYQFIWAGAPILLLFIGGMLGAVFGVLAAYLNARIFRSSLPPVLKYVVTTVITGAAVTLYFILAILLNLAVNNG